MNCLQVNRHYRDVHAHPDTEQGIGGYLPDPGFRKQDPLFVDPGSTFSTG